MSDEERHVELYDYEWDPLRGVPTPPDDIRAFPGRRPGTGTLSRAQRQIDLPESLARPAPAALIQLPPPELVQYPQAVSIYGSGQATGLANGTSTELFRIEVPGGMVGVIRSFALNGVNLVVALDASFSILINGGPVPGWTRSMPPQTSVAAGIAWNPDECLIRIPDGAIVSVNANVTAGGPADLGAAIAGWIYPVSVQNRYLSVWEQ